MSEQTQPRWLHRLVASARARDPDGSRTVLLVALGLLVGFSVGSVVIADPDTAGVSATAGGGEEGAPSIGTDGEVGTGDGSTSPGATSLGVTTPSRQRGGRTISDGGGGGSGANTAGSGGSQAGAREARGITADSIKIGVALPDIEAFGNVSEDFNVGDQQEQMEAVLEGWRDEGLVPVHGRDIEFVYEVFDILNPDEKIAACNRFVKDHQVFAVLAGRFFEDGAECVAERFDTPVVSVNSGLDEFYQRTAPYLFTIRAPWATLFRSWVAWADVNGHFQGHTIGLFFESEVKPAVEVGITQEMEKRGYSVAAEVEASGAGVGTSQDQVAVQRFRQAGVDLVMFVGGGTSAINFMTFAESQGYRPDYIDTDYGEHTTDAAAGAYPPEQYAGTFAMTATRVGEVAAGHHLAAPTTDCVDDYERFSGKEIGPTSPETAEYNSVLISCDLADPMLRGLQGAGRELHPASLIAGLESINDMTMAVHGNLSFAPDRHWGVDQQRTVQWKRTCGCWVAVSPAMSAFFV